MADQYLVGYPVDLRDDALRARDASGPYGDFEGRAARVIARATGLKVTLQDDNRKPRTPDLKLEDVDSVVGFGEVVTTTDGARADQLRAFAAGKLRIDSDEIHTTWWVTVTPRADRRILATVLIDRLARLEKRGDHVLVRQSFTQTPNPPEIIELERLGLTEIHCDPTPREGSGRVYGLPGGIGGPVEIDWDACSSWVARFLRSDLCLRKVKKATDASRQEAHLYVGVTGNDPWPVHQALDDGITEICLPAPALPTGLTHLWLDAAEYPGRVISWWPDRGWFDPRKWWVTD